MKCAHLGIPWHQVRLWQSAVGWKCAGQLEQPVLTRTPPLPAAAETVAQRKAQRAQVC